MPQSAVKLSQIPSISPFESLIVHFLYCLYSIFQIISAPIFKKLRSFIDISRQYTCTRSLFFSAPVLESVQTLESTDEELLKKFTKGQKQAFEILYMRYKRKIFTYIVNFIKNPSAAEEVMQDVFLRVIKNADNFKSKSKFSTWLYKITKNLCIDWKRKSSNVLTDSLDKPDNTTGEPHKNRLKYDDADPEYYASMNGLQKELVKAIQALPEKQKQVFLLKEISGLKFHEIAKIIDDAEATIKSRMRYALETLREKLKHLSLSEGKIS